MSEKVEEIKQAEPEKKQGNKKTIIIAIAVAMLVFIILGAQTIFALLTLITVALLIYKAVKKKPLKNAAIACAVCLLLTGICGQFSSSDYMEILSMSKEEVDRKYGEPTASGVSYVYPEGFSVSYFNDECWIFNLNSSSKELLGLKLGDEVSTIQNELKSYGYEYIGKRNYGSQVIYSFQNNMHMVQVYASGNIISDVQVMNL